MIEEAHVKNNHASRPAASQGASTSTPLAAKVIPFALTLGIIAADQITKALVVRLVPLNTVAVSLGGDFFRIIHERNHGIAFSMGGQLPGDFRTVFFALLPIVVLALLVGYYFRSRDLSPLQRWAIAGIVGGGVGNLIDRVFRPGGVVDFLDVKFYGIFGLERWPTFNVADSSVVVCGILLLVTFLFDGGSRHEQKG